MKRRLGIALLAIAAVPCLVHAQDRGGSELQLHARQGPPPQSSDEQLLPLSSVPPFVVPDPKKYPQRYAAVYMPVSRATGRVRTPEFRVAKGQWYDIALQVEVPRASNRQMTPGVRQYAVELVRSKYADFGPTLAAEVLFEKHGVKVGRETLRRWLITDGLWLSRKQQVS